MGATTARRCKEVRKIKVHGQWRWQARVSSQGKRLSQLCETEEDAKRVKAELRLRLLSDAKQENREGATPATLGLLFEGYALDLEARGKGEETVSRAGYVAAVIRAVMPELLNRPVERLSNADLFAFRNARLQAGVKPGTINRDLRVLRAALKKVRPEYRFPAGLFFPEDDTRVRWLRTEEEALLFASIRSPFGEMAQLAALTLMRLSEIRLLRRDQVDLVQGVIVLAKAKGAPGVVMLSAAARGILEAQLKCHESEWVFPAPHGRPFTRCYVGGIFRKASRAVGLRDFHFHDLRHHGATMALNANYTAPIVMALGRWKSEKMMRRYAAVTDKTLRAAAEAVSGNTQWQQWAKPAPPKVCITPCQDRALVLHKADL